MEGNVGSTHIDRDGVPFQRERERGEKEKEDRRWMDGKERGGGRWDGGINHDVVD